MAYMGKLSISDLNLNVNVYDLDKNYLAVKNMWLGFEDWWNLRYIKVWKMIILL